MFDKYQSLLSHHLIKLQIGHALRYLSQFIVGFAIGFTSVWQLTLLTLVVVPLIALAGAAYTIIMSTLSEKSEAAYAEAGKIAEEVHSLATSFNNFFQCFSLHFYGLLMFTSSFWSYFLQLDYFADSYRVLIRRRGKSS